MKPITLTAKPTNWSAKEDISISWQAPKSMMQEWNTECEHLISNIQKAKRLGPKDITVILGYAQRHLDKIKALVEKGNTLWKE